MNALKIQFALGILALCVGCASSTLQTDALLANPSNLPPRKVIENVPFVEQTAGHCGPATLTMAMNWAGKKVSVEEIAPHVFTPGMKGSFQLDMITASRRNGMMALPLRGLPALMTELNAGHPVIVFENLALSWLPQWHYALVFGYDLDQQKILMHSGPEASKRWDLRKFERSWKLGEYWGLVVLPPGQLAASADEMAHVRAASALEHLGKLAEAESSYEGILKKWPTSLGTHIGLANIAFGKKEYARAEKFLLKATAEHADSAMAWFNLSIAQAAVKKALLAKKSRERALSLATPEQKVLFEKNL